MTTKKVTKKRSSKRNKKLTLKEFQAWLQGVEELQPDDWSPNSEQWQKIREKIHNIVEEEPEVRYVEVGGRSNEGTAWPAAGAPPSGAAPATSPGTNASGEFEPAGGSLPVEPTGPPVGRSTLGGTEIRPPSGGGAAGDGGPPLPVSTDSSGKKRIKTPDIDTSDGSYVPSFE